MDVIIGPLFKLLITVVNLYMWVVIIGVVLSWLTAFNVINTRNQVVYRIMDFTHRLTEPALRPLRRIIPSISGMDLSPMVLILLLYLIEDVLTRLMLRMMGL